VNAESYSRVVELCQAVWAVSPETQAKFLQDVCGDDCHLLQEVEAMLDADRRAGRFLCDAPIDLVSHALASPASRCSPGDMLGDYEIIARLGAGGMAEVFLAQDVKLDRKVALKFLPGELSADPGWLRRLQQEARVASRLNHPNILTVYGFGEAAGLHYIATELVEGDTLRRILDSGALAPSIAIEIATQVAAALQAAHGAGIVHCDVKPENIVRRSDGLIKLLDFGVAERAGENKYPAGVITGTPQYMSPEQASGRSTDARTDLFSLGLVLYEMLAGHPAFQGITVSGTLEQVLSRNPPPLKLKKSRCPRMLVRIIVGALEKDPDKRFQNAAEMHAALEAAGRRIRRRFTYSKNAAMAAVVIFGSAISVTYRYFHAPVTTNIQSIAVLPLEDLSHAESQAYFSDAVTDQLIADLSRAHGLRVISLSSAMQFKRSPQSPRQIAKELKVDALVGGSIARLGSRVRITAKLTRAKPEQTLWTDSYERNVDDLPALQIELARTIARQLQKDLSTRAQPERSRTSPISTEARDLYNMGQYNANKGTEEGYMKAIGFFERAIAQSPSFAAAYGRLSFAYVQLSCLAFHYLAPKEGMPKAKAAALKALELDDGLADAHNWLGYIKLTFDRDWKGAEHEIERALTLNPNSADAHLLNEWYLLARRRFDDAHREVERARELDPLSLRMLNEEQFVRIDARRYREAIDLGRQIIDTEPEFVPALYFNAMAYAEVADYPKAIAAARHAIRIQNVQSNVLLLAHVAARAGKYQWAERLIAESKAMSNNRYLCPFEVATAYVSLHRKKEVYEWLDKAAQDRVDCMIYLETEPWMDNLRGDTEYRALLRELNIPSS
jgi:eukaryotic-like serine/threonine-protein kinase